MKHVYAIGIKCENYEIPRAFFFIPATEVFFNVKIYIIKDTVGVKMFCPSYKKTCQLQEAVTIFLFILRVTKKKN